MRLRPSFSGWYPKRPKTEKTCNGKGRGLFFEHQCDRRLEWHSVQHKIGIVAFTVGKIAARDEALEHATCEDRERQMRRLQAVARTRHPARTDGAEPVDAVLVRRRAAEADEMRIERNIAPGIVR